LLILDRSFDIQSPLTFDYTYHSQVFENFEEIPDNFCIDKLAQVGPLLKQAKKKADPNAGSTTNFLNNTDFIWSKYKCAHIVEVHKMLG